MKTCRQIYCNLVCFKNLLTKFFIIFYSNWTEWCTIQGVTTRLVLKSDEHDYSLNCKTRGPITN